ncbi:MAG: hypothetical protein M1833_000694 [Piccolia ochrophora]|nr:MAG: hypothetical protein M1833_000694 [Piccolia ochrophora]
MPDSTDHSQSEAEDSTPSKDADASEGHGSQTSGNRDRARAPNEQVEGVDSNLGLLVLSDGAEERTPCDIVAVHGLYGDRLDTWKYEEKEKGEEDKPPSSSWNWLEEGFSAEGPSPRVLTFGYDASLSSNGIATAAGVEEKALHLLDALVECRKSIPPAVSRPLVFIAHDLGGIVVKKALCIASHMPAKYGRIADSARLLVFFGCPHRSKSLQDMEDVVAHLIISGHKSPLTSVQRTITELANCIIETNGSFVSSKMLLYPTIVNVYSKYEDDKSRVLSKQTATLDIAFEEVSGRLKPHKNLCKYAQFDDDSLPLIATILSRDNYASDPSSDISTHIQTFCSLAAPIYPLETPDAIDHRFDWLSEDESYLKWLNTRGPALLYVYGSQGVTPASNYLSQHLKTYQDAKTEGGVFLYFRFQKCDDRRNSATAMLSTLLAQLLNHRQHLNDYIAFAYDRMLSRRSCSERELFRLFRYVLQRPGVKGTICFISGLDECDDSRMVFLERLLTWAGLSEWPIKFVLTGAVEPEFPASVAEWHFIHLDDSPQHSNKADTRLASDIELEVSNLMHRRPFICHIRRAVVERLSQCGQDTNQRRLIINHLEASETLSTQPAADYEAIQLLSVSPREIFGHIMSNVPLSKRKWARSVLTWILYGFRPLSIEEMSVALALVESDRREATEFFDALDHRGIVSDINRVFRGLIILQDGEFHVLSSDAREFLLETNPKGQELWYEVHQTVHQEISQSCQRYLSLPQVAYSLESFEMRPTTHSTESPTSIPHYNLHEYAVRYWARHYQLIPNNSRANARVDKFTRDRKLVKSCAEACWRYSNPLTRANRGFSSLLPVFAGFGLEDFVQEDLELDPNTPIAHQDRGLALVEAARTGQLHVIRKLLSFGGYSQTVLQEALIIGASCNGAEVLDELVTYSAKSRDNFDWPPDTLCRAAEFGFDNVVKTLVDSGVPVDWSNTADGFTPLHFAVREQHEDTARFLLERQASPTKPNNYELTALHLAAYNCEEAVMQLLVDNVSDIDVPSPRNNGVMVDACNQGNFKAVEILIRNGWKMDPTSIGDWSPLIAATYAGLLKCTRLLLEDKANPDIAGPEGWTPLRYAAFDRDIELCRLLLQHGADANYTGGPEPILVMSARMGKLEIVKLLVQDGAATIDATTSDGSTALTTAAGNGHAQIVAYLLDSGANKDQSDNDAVTPLMMGCVSNSVEIVRLLVTAGASLDEQSSTSKWGAIHLATNHCEITRILMEHGANANLVGPQGTALNGAVTINRIEVVEILLSFHSGLEALHNRVGNTAALRGAIQNGHKDIARLLLEAGADVNERFGGNNFSIQYPVVNDQEALLRVLLEYRPDLELVDNEGDTALHCVTRTTPISVAKLLVNGGHPLETCNKVGFTPLCKATRMGNLDLVQYLIQKKAQINVTGSRFGGPLHIACRGGEIELIKALIAAGANVDLVDPALGTPLASACGLDDKDAEQRVIRYLLSEANADVKVNGGLKGSALNSACGWSTPETVQLILRQALDQGVQTDVPDEMGRTAIHLAASQSLEHFHPILNAGADVEMKDNMGRTILHWAVLSGLLEVVERVVPLLGDEVDQTDVNGWTPLLWAARGQSRLDQPTESNRQAATEIVRFLLDRGADARVVGRGINREWTPTTVAKYHGADDQIVQLLLAKKRMDERPDDDSDRALELLGKAQCHEDIGNFDLCYTCYLVKDRIHADHPFEEMGPEYEVVFPDHVSSEKRDSESEEAEDTESDEDTDDED